MSRIIKILDIRFASIICILFALTNRIIFTSLYSLMSTDTGIQLTYAQNFLAGKRMGVTKYFTSNLSTPVYDTHLLFPPGWSLTIIPFLKLTSGNEYRALFLFDVLAATLFVVAMRILGKKAGLSTAYNNILSLIIGCSQYVFFMSWSSTDVISLCFILFSFSLLIDIIYLRKELNLFKIVGYSLLFCMPFFFRYQYLFIAVLLPLLIFTFGIYSKNKTLKSFGWKLLIGSFSWLLLISLIYLNIGGNIIHINTSERGLFFNQILHWYPFIPSSFINLDFAAQLATRVTGINYRNAMLLFEVTNILLLIMFIFFIIRYVQKNKPVLVNSRNSIFFISGSVIVFCVIFLLAYLSLTYKDLEWGYIKWNFSTDERYFAFIYVFIPTLLLSFLNSYPYALKKPIVRLLACVVFVIYFVEVAHGIYYNAKIILQHKDLMVIKNSDIAYKQFPGIISQIKTQYPDRQILITSPDQFYLHAASQMEFKAIFDYQNLSKNDLIVNSKSILILPVHQNEVVIMKEYLDKKRPRSITTSDGTYFYIEELNP